MLDGENAQLPVKKQKLIHTNEDSSASKGKRERVVQNNCALISIICSIDFAIGDALRNAGVLKEDQHVFKEDDCL